MLVNCTAGVGSLEALTSVGAGHLAGKVIADISVPLDFSAGFPPSLFVCNTDSLGEQIQRAFPEALVVKTLNTMNCAVMADPASVPGDHDVFVSGNDDGAKAKVRDLLESFGSGQDRSSTWETSAPAGGPRCICRSGSASTARSAPARSTSR